MQLRPSAVLQCIALLALIGCGEEVHEDAASMSAPPNGAWESAAAPTDAETKYVPPAEVAAVHRREVEEMIAEEQAEGSENADYDYDGDVWHAFDLDGDGATEFVVFFLAQGYPGPNHYTRYVAVYGSRGAEWTQTSLFAVGGKGWASVGGEDVALTNGRLIVRDVLTYAESDGMCCPSVPGELILEVRGRGLVEPNP